MSSDIDSFYTDLRQEIAASASANGEFTRTAMIDNLMRRLVEAEELQDWTPCFFNGRGHRRRSLSVDGYSVDEMELDGTLHMIVVEPHDGSDVQSLTTGDVTAAFDRSIAFVDDAREGRLHNDLEPSTPAADLAKLIYDSKELIRTVRVILLSNKALGARFKKVDKTTLTGVKCELHIWDLVRFHRLADAGGREEIDIDVTPLVSGGIPALPAGIGGAGYHAYLCVVPGQFLADIYEEYGSRLLEGNVRAFLSARGKVNQGIRRTILNQPDRFFAFNNGITATATHVDINAQGQISRILDLQIVNGGQTTASLFNTRLGDKVSLSNIYVQMKLSVLPPETAMAMIPEISRYANTQNKVSEADLFANHPFNRKIETLSRQMWAPPRAGSHQMTHWFYERARAQYQTEQIKLTAAQRKAFQIQNPKDQVIVKTDLAKYENTYGKLPHIVSLGAQKNFIKYAEAICEEYERRPDDFNERWFQHLVAKAILFGAAERIVSKASWYTNAYRANIVTYAIARLVHLVNEKYPGAVLDLDLIWKNQAASDAVEEQIERTARVAHRVLTAPPQEGANVTEWAKRKDCWDRTASEPVAVVPEFIRSLKESGEERDDRNRARSEEREVVTINAAMEVIRLGQEGFWHRALNWRNTRRLLKPVELGILETAVTRGGTWAPSDAQAKKLMDVAGKLKADGLS